MKLGYACIQKRDVRLGAGGDSQDVSRGGGLPTSPEYERLYSQIYGHAFAGNKWVRRCVNGY